MKRLFKCLSCLAAMTLLSSCGLAQTQTLTESVTVEHQKISLTLSMQIDSPILQGQQWLAKFQIRNNSLSAISLLPWGTPWEGAFSRSMFNIESASGKIEYSGPMIKRRAPSLADYIEIQPGASRLIEVDVSSAYNPESLEISGDYSVTYLPSSLALISKGQELVVAVPGLATIKVQVVQKNNVSNNQQQ